MRSLIRVESPVRAPIDDSLPSANGASYQLEHSLWRAGNRSGLVYKRSKELQFTLQLTGPVQDSIPSQARH